MNFVDLFCGVGGFRLGMEEQGFECVMSCDIDKNCAKTYALNFNEDCQSDVRKISPADMPDFDVLCAGFPCQPFSISGRRMGFNDTRGTLFFEILRILEHKQPPVVFLENVKNLKYHNKGKTFKRMVECLEELGYEVSWRILNARNFGVPQNRERLIIIASKKGKFDFDKLEMNTQESMVDFLDPEGSFTYLDPSEYTLIENPKRQPKTGLTFVGYLNKKLRKAGVKPGTEMLSRSHKQPNRIYSVEGIQPTLSSQETAGRYYILDRSNRVRKLTINECWRMMGFPEDFKKVKAATEQYRQLGNSICVPMVSEIAKQIRAQFF